MTAINLVTGREMSVDEVAAEIAANQRDDFRDEINEELAAADMLVDDLRAENGRLETENQRLQRENDGMRRLLMAYERCQNRGAQLEVGA